MKKYFSLLQFHIECIWLHLCNIEIECVTVFDLIGSNITNGFNDTMYITYILWLIKLRFSAQQLPCTLIFTVHTTRLYTLLKSHLTITNEVPHTNTKWFFSGNSPCIKLWETNGYPCFHRLKRFRWAN